MAKSKKETSAVLAPIDYLRVIDDYNVEAFHFCVEQLFPLFELKVLTPRDIRPVDLKEQVVQLSARLSLTTDEQSNATILSYCFQLHWIFDLIVYTEKDSRAQEYKDRALELLSQVENGEQKLQYIEDALLILVALEKPLQGEIIAFDGKKVGEPDFAQEMDNLKILKEIWNAINEIENTSILGFKKKRINENSSNKVKLWYLHSVIILCHLLQERGVFAPEE